jgi:hypothetical protein
MARYFEFLSQFYGFNLTHPRSTIDRRIKAEGASEGPRNEKIRKRKNQYIQNKMFKEDTK